MAFPLIPSPAVAAKQTKEWTELATKMARDTAMVAGGVVVASFGLAAIRAAGKAASSAAKTGSDTAASVSKTLGEQLDFVAKIFSERVGPGAIKVLENDDTTRLAARAIYEVAVPLPVKLVLREEAFADFCVEHKNGLLERIATLQKNPAQEEPSTPNVETLE